MKKKMFIISIKRLYFLNNCLKMDYDDVNKSVQIKSMNNNLNYANNEVQQAIDDLYNNSESSSELEVFYKLIFIQLSISCQNLYQMDKRSNSDPFVVVYMTMEGYYKEIGRTEILIDEKKYFYNYNFIKQSKIYKNI